MTETKMTPALVAALDQRLAETGSALDDLIEVMRRQRREYGSSQVMANTVLAMTVVPAEVQGELLLTALYRLAFPEENHADSPAAP